MSLGSERVLILAPFGRDGLLLQQALAKGQIEAEVCASLGALSQAMTEGVGALLIGDEALGPSEIAQLRQILQEQPAWSDVSLLVMTSGGEANLASRRRLQLLEPLQATLTLLERPLRAATLLSVMQTALRARRRQYQLRDLWEKEKQNAASLQLANQALRQSNERLAEFAHVASHDLQEPLRTVSAYTQLLGQWYRGQLDAQADEYIQFATEGAARMSQLIEDLLRYSRVTAEADQTEAQSDGQAALQVAQENLRALLQETGSEIRSSPLPVVAVEFRHLVQLFQNILGNALKYRKREEPPQIRIQATRRESSWLFQVSDNGIGFDPEHAEQIFGVFKRLHRNEEKGTGIGLAI
jgi:signal transduction histidine kinase